MDSRNCVDVVEIWREGKRMEDGQWKGHRKSVARGLWVVPRYN